MTHSYLMKMRAAPLGGMLPGMAIEDSEEALALDGVKVDDKRVRVLHGAAATHML